MAEANNIWIVYILECADNTLYTGITNNINIRIKAHNDGNGAKYTKGRSPVSIAYTEVCTNRSGASKREREIKKLNRNSKLELISNFQY